MIDAAIWQDSRLLQTCESSEQGIDILVCEGDVIQPNGAPRPFGQLAASRDRYPVMFVVVGQKDETACVEDDLRSQDEAVPFHHRIEVSLRAQHDVREFTG